jgi:predicted transcriptional regulator
LNVGLNKTEKAVLGLLLETPDKTAEEMASEVGVTKRTIERAFASLQKKRKIEELVLREMACGWL